jgi:hypothetical protein
MINILKKKQKINSTYCLKDKTIIEPKNNELYKYEYKNKSIDFNTMLKLNKENKFNKDYKHGKENNIIYYPSSSKEWSNSIYSYNKSYVNLLINADVLINKIFKSYFNMGKSKIKNLFKRQHVRNWKQRYSANKIYVSKTELKYNNKKLLIILYIYNKQKLVVEQLIIKIINFVTTKKNNIYINNRNKNSLNLKNRLWYLLNKRFFSFKKWNIVFTKKSYTMLKYILLNLKSRHFMYKISTLAFIKYLLKLEVMIYKYKKLMNINMLKFAVTNNLGFNFSMSHKHNRIMEQIIYQLKYLLPNIKNRYNKLHKMYVYNIKHIKKLFKLEEIFFKNIKFISFNESKFNNLFLNMKNIGLINFLDKIYNKNTEIKIIELKSIDLNSDVFSSAIALKLRDRKKNVVKILRKAILNIVKIPDLHSLLIYDDVVESINKNNIVNVLKQKVVSGIRFEASGRLTRRLTALRSVFKYRYIGSLKDIRSSYNNKSSTMLRGHIKSNLQYQIINSKTRNGTFGLKTWISSH